MKAIEWTMDAPPAEAAAYLHGMFWIRAGDGQRYVADFENQRLMKADFFVEQAFSEGFGFVRCGPALETLELRSAQGDAVAGWVTPPGGHWFQPRAPFSQGLCPVMTDTQRFGFMNTKGEMTVEPQYALAEGFTEGYARVLPGEKGKGGGSRGQLINLKGETVKRGKGIYLSGVHEGSCMELLDRRSIRVTRGFHGGPRSSTEISLKGDAYLRDDWQGEAMIPYGGRNPFSDRDVGLVHLFRGEAGPMCWDEAEQSRCGLSRVWTGKKNPLVRFVNEHFEPAGGFFKEAQGFSEGVCAVLGRHRRWSFIDIDGRPAFNGAFEETTAMYRGVALVRTGGKWGAIDRGGRFLTERGEWDDVCGIGGQHECFFARRGAKRYIVLRTSLRRRQAWEGSE